MCFYKINNGHTSFVQLAAPSVRGQPAGLALRAAPVVRTGRVVVEQVRARRRPVLLLAGHVHVDTDVLPEDVPPDLAAPPVGVARDQDGRGGCTSVVGRAVARHADASGGGCGLRQPDHPDHGKRERRQGGRNASPVLA